MFGWLLRLFGFGSKAPAQAGPGPAAAAAPGDRSSRDFARERERERDRDRSHAAHPVRLSVHPSQDPAEFKAQRRRLLVYVMRARVPIRQAAAARQLWIADLGKVYEAIRTSPIPVVLERAGDAGFRYEPAFRESLSLAQSIEAPPEAEELHQALVDWLTATHGACLALMDARRLKDRSMLGTFRERLGLARRHAATLATLRAEIFTLYQLRVQPQVKAKRAAPAVTDESAEQQPAATGPAARRGNVRAVPARAPAGRPSARPAARRPGTRPAQPQPAVRRRTA